MSAARRLVFASILPAYLCLSLAHAAFGFNKELERMIHDGRLPDATPLEQVNDFVSHSRSVGKLPDKTVQVRDGKVVAKLITPLNSSFNMTGDEVQAVVVGSVNQYGKPFLEEGTILQGTVEVAKKATYGETDGTLVIRFYTAKFGDHQIELFTTSDTDDGKLKPGAPKPPTKKQKIRGVLMTVSRVAIPAAVGTGGMSLAISAGAGAAIGLAFSDKGKRVQGTVRGAWEGAGLTFLDPIVCKGRSVILPEGTPLGLQLTEPVQVPPYIGVNAKAGNTFSDISGSILSKQQTEASAVTSLSTHAQIVKPGTGSRDRAEEDNHLLDGVNKKIAQNDLAGALVELTAQENLYPHDESLKQMHTELFNLVSGKTTSALK